MPMQMAWACSALPSSRPPLRLAHEQPYLQFQLVAKFRTELNQQPRRLAAGWVGRLSGHDRRLQVFRY